VPGPVSRVREARGNEKRKKDLPPKLAASETLDGVSDGEDWEVGGGKAGLEGPGWE
jgi:hypothetical protein